MFKKVISALTVSTVLVIGVGTAAYAVSKPQAPLAPTVYTSYSAKGNFQMSINLQKNYNNGGSVTHMSWRLYDSKGVLVKSYTGNSSLSYTFKGVKQGTYKGNYSICNKAGCGTSPLSTLKYVP